MTPDEIKRPIRKELEKPYTFKIKKVWKPPADHPWRTPKTETYSHNHSYSQKEKGLLLVKT